jgi:hypothetical protein
MDAIVKYPNRWTAGVSGNPNGRPVGSRQKFSQTFADDFLTVWNESGIEAVRKLAQTNFEAFVAIVARILPKDFALTVEQALAPWTNRIWRS